MSSSNTSSSPLSPPPPSLESNKTTMNMYNHWLSFSNSSTSATKIFGDNTPAMRKAMQILEDQFGHPHISSSSSSNNTNINHVVNNTKQMTVNVPIVFYPPNISADPASQSRELPPQTFTFVATAGVDVGNGNKNKRKRKTKNINRGRIYSLPHLKYGPYTCSKCLQVVPTSQKFANHVTEHYKLDREEEEKKRKTSETQERSDLQSDQSEVVPVNNENLTQISPSPPLSGLKVKIESGVN
ncbi:hypothetical protein P8452_42546 [Trifolium repens]|nr:hypothetical protein P8452_42546 [Trifolium repens]